MHRSNTSAFPPLTARLRGYLAWAGVGAIVHACMPGLHHAVTPAGPVALWLWLLPLAAFGLELLWAPPAARADMRPRRRRRTNGSLNRRERPAPTARRSAQPGRRAGSG